MSQALSISSRHFLGFGECWNEARSRGVETGLIRWRRLGGGDLIDFLFLERPSRLRTPLIIFCILDDFSMIFLFWILFEFFVLWFMINVKVQMLIYWLDGAKSYQLAAISDCLNQVRLGQSDFDLVDYLQLTLKVSYPTEKSPFDIWTLLNSEMNLVVY